LEEFELDNDDKIDLREKGDLPEGDASQEEKESQGDIKPYDNDLDYLYNEFLWIKAAAENS
jgi:hypothetical protein